MSSSLDPDQARHFVMPDLVPICLQKLSADDNNRQSLFVHKLTFTFSNQAFDESLDLSNISKSHEHQKYNYQLFNKPNKPLQKPPLLKLYVH